MAIHSQTDLLQLALLNSRIAFFVQNWTIINTNYVQTFVFEVYQRYNNFILSGATLEIITDKSQEGAQFCKGFGGIGGL